MKTYAEKLKDPKWDKVRRTILRRDNYTCVSCSATGTTLDVHHGYYEKNTEPWDYPQETLHTLCRHCHETAEFVRAQVYRELAIWQPIALKGLLFYLYQSRDFNMQVENIKRKNPSLNVTTEFGEEVNNV